MKFEKSVTILYSKNVAARLNYYIEKLGLKEME